MKKLPRIGVCGGILIAVLLLVAATPKAKAVAGDECWDSQLATNGVNGTVYSLTISATNLYVGGQFTLAGNQAVSNVASFDGHRWSNLGGGIGYSFGVNDPYMYVVLLSAEGSRLYATTLEFIGGGLGLPMQLHSVAQWDGSNWTSVGGLELWWQPIWAMMASGGRVFIGGHFRPDMYGYTAPGNDVAMWNDAEWSALSNGVDGCNWCSDGVTALAVNGTNVYVGGSFTSVSGVPANNIAKWDGSQWSALGDGVNGTVQAIVLRGGEVVVGGSFTNAGGIAAAHVAKWNGTSWEPLGDGVNGPVTALATDGTNLYAAGPFTNAGIVAVNHIARWDGQFWSALGSGVDGSINAIAVNGSDVYVGGSFTTAGGKASQNLAHWNRNPVIMTESELPTAVVGTFYSLTLSAICGISPYSWSISSNGLPDGLSLASDTGVISGTPTIYGTSNFTVRCTGDDSAYAEKAFSLTINPTAWQAWQIQYFPGGPANPYAAPDADPLGKGMSNTNQYLAGLNPTNAASVFRVSSTVATGNDFVVTWKTAGPRTNFVQATNGGPGGGFSNNFQNISDPIIINVTGDTTTNYTDVGGATNVPSRFYRIRLGP